MIVRWPDRKPNQNRTKTATKKTGPRLNPIIKLVCADEPIPESGQQLATAKKTEQKKQEKTARELSGWRLKPVRINLSGHMLNFTCGDFSTWPAELQFQVVVT